MKNLTNYRSTLFVNKKFILETISFLLILALCVNLISTTISALFSIYMIMAIVFCLACISAFYVWSKIFYNRVHRHKLRGTLVFDQDHNSIQINRYKFSQDIYRYFNAICEENTALKNILYNKPLIERKFDSNKHTYSIGKTEACQLLIEAVEYFFLSRLSLHLSGHFHNNDTVDDDLIEKIDRTGIPSIFFKNRFLAHFSQPTNERAVFSDIPKSSDESNQKIVYAVGRNGVIYSSFELILPKNSSIKRDKNGSISLVTKRFSINLHIDFQGFNTNLPVRFEELYLNEDPAKLQAYDIPIKVEIRFSKFSMFSSKGLQYYEWIDSFLEEFEDDFSFASFISQIGWEHGVTVAMVAESIRSAKLLESTTEN